MQDGTRNYGIFNMRTSFLIFLGFIFLFVFIVCCVKLNFRQDNGNIEKFSRVREYEMQVKKKYKDSSPQIEFADDDLDEDLGKISETDLKKNDMEIAVQSPEREMVKLKKLTIAFDDDVQTVELEANTGQKDFEDIQFH